MIQGANWFRSRNCWNFGSWNFLDGGNLNLAEVKKRLTSSLIQIKQFTRLRFTSWVTPKWQARNTVWLIIMTCSPVGSDGVLFRYTETSAVWKLSHWATMNTKDDPESNQKNYTIRYDSGFSNLGYNLLLNLPSRCLKWWSSIPFNHVLKTIFWSWFWLHIHRNLKSVPELQFIQYASFRRRYSLL